MRAAIYARFSSDKQSENSIEDQSRNCERYAERWGMSVVLRFEDKAISGASKNRAGLDGMIAAAMRGDFDVLLVDDLSRMSRDLTDTRIIIKRFKFRRIRIVGVSDGYDSMVKGEKIQSTMRGLMNELFLDDLREKTHRGLYGKAMNGFSAGGRTYGYRRVPIEDPTRKDVNGRPEIIAVKREVDQEQAKWVQKIFEWFAAGDSPKGIASKLNQLNVTSARGSTWAASAIYGDHRNGTGLLNNQLYIGRYIWNRSEWHKDPDTGKRKRIKREEKDWVVTEIPELRIVPQELWDAVQARHEETKRRSVHLREVLNNPQTRSHSGKYLFSGLLQCGCCGASYTIYSTTSYGCATNINRGDAACSNRLRVSRKIIEECLLDIIRKDLLSEEAFNLFHVEINKWIKRGHQDDAAEIDVQKRRLAETERQLANIMKAINEGIITPTTKEALLKAEAEHEKAKAEINSASQAAEVVINVMPRVKERYKALVSDLGRALYTDVAQARQCLKGLLGKIRLLPNSKGSIDAELRYNEENLIKLALGGGLKVGLVAGGGFEPPTFRL